MEELDYENELSELALEYVDEIVSEYGPYLNKKRKRVSTQHFNSNFNSFT